MNDLNVINRKNAEAIQRDIPNQQALGKWVTAEYSGLHFVGYSVHDTEAQANAKAFALVNPNSPSTRSTVFRPTNTPAQAE